jgi:predicted pyridoxine 5'-phosphate oxidase superfamily flavin-nucleotide-binding protein
MAKLTPEMKAMFEKQLALIVTASKSGVPNAAPKGSTFVYDDQTIVFSENRGKKTYRNLVENPRAAVVIVDRENGVGWQVKGSAEILNSGPLYDVAAKRAESRNRPRPIRVVRITVEETYPVVSSTVHK